MTIRFAILLSMGAAFAADKPAVEDPDALLKKIKARTAEHLTQLPNYTCHEVIDRMLRRGTTWNRLDTVELEVAFVGREELFSRPGESRFEERHIERIVPAGTIGNGAFGSHIETVFSSDVAEFQFNGIGKKDGHKTYRYDFRVPQERSQFLVKHGSAEGIVPYEGSVWVDVETLDLVEVDLKVKQIPARIGVRFIEETMHYKVMQIGNSEFLLPRTSELAASDEAGNYSLNQVKLDRCREFTGDSVVKYGGPTEGTASRDREQH